VAGDLQVPSGTDFDPSPQFWVDRVELDGPGSLAVVGRCFFGPVRTGLAFDAIVPRRDGGWPSSGLVACFLRVAEAWVSRRLVEEVDQGLSARLVLSGEAPDCLAASSVLVARVQSGEGWEFNGRLWTR
jgi:hypothetical protein